MEEFERKGRFWVPERPKQTLDGTLRYSTREGAELWLSGLLGGHPQRMPPVPFSTPAVILGVEPNGAAISLIRCARKGMTIGGGYDTSTYSAQVVLLGAHFETSEQLQFESISIKYSHLDDWAEFRYFDFDKQGDTQTLAYRWPPTYEATVQDAKVGVVASRHVVGSGTPPRAVTVEHEARIRIETESPAPLDRHLRVAQLVQILLSLALGLPLYPLRIDGTHSRGKHKQRVEIWYQVPREAAAASTPSRDRILFTLPDIAERFEEIVRKWFENAEVLEPVYHLYFGTLASRGIIEQHRFLSLVQALESFHRRRYGGAYLTREEYGPVYERLTETIPESVAGAHRKALEKRIYYGNEFSLAKRLRQLIRKHREALGEIVENRDSFIRQVTQTRNYLTHYDEESRKGAILDAAGLYLLGQKLATVLEICLLAELGFAGGELQRQAGILAFRRKAEPIEWA